MTFSSGNLIRAPGVEADNLRWLTIPEGLNGFDFVRLTRGSGPRMSRHLVNERGKRYKCQR